MVRINIQKAFVNKYEIRDLKKNLINNKQLTEFFLVNTDYRYNLEKMANTYALNVKFLEMVLFHYITNKDSINYDKLKKEITSVYRFMNVYKESTGVIVLRGTIDKSNILIANNRFFEDCKDLINIMKNNQNMKKGMFPYAMLLIIGVAIMLFYSMTNNMNKELTYNEFNKALNENKIKEVVITPSTSAYTYHINGKLKDAKKGDFVYFDPPYDSDISTFNSYTEDGFGKEEQIRLAKVFKELDEKGVYVMLSNHNTILINELYKDYNIHIIEAKRSINSKGNKRGNVEEVIITNYEVDTSLENL